LFDVLDENGSPTGTVKARGDVHRDGDWHGALHIWVGGCDENGRPFALFQRRSRSKDTWPGALDVAVGGHLRAGETLAQAIREADEEIGLDIGLADLTRLGRRFAGGDGRADNEVQEVFAARSDLPLDAYRLHPDEVDAVVSVPLADALALFEGRAAEVAGHELGRGSSTPAAVRITVAGFAAGEVGGYAVHALRGLLEVVAGGVPAPFELR
jgi:isopentenyldiphosphate isomerase